jgi:hypothetical protein
MSVQQDLLDLGGLFNFSDLSTFTQTFLLNGHPFQASLPILRRSTDRDGCGKSDFSNGKAVGRAKGGCRRDVSGSPSSTFETKDSENFKNPVSSKP